MKKFVDFIQTIFEKQYNKRMERSLRRRNVIKILLFYDMNLKIYNQIIEMMENANIEIDFVCVPDQLGLKIDLKDFNRKVIRLSEISGYSNDEELLIFRREDMLLGGKFEEYIRDHTGANVDVFSLPNVDYNGIYDLIQKNLDKIYDVYNILDDNISKEVYLATLLYRISGDMNDLIFQEGQQYFLPTYSVRKGDVIVDGGAYDGMSAYDFLTVVGGEGKVISFELDADNYQNIQQKKLSFPFNDSDIVVENMGLGLSEGTFSYLKANTASTLNNHGNYKAKVIDLDTYINKSDFEHVDFIKLDIEGAEMDALIGASCSISKWKPRMSICLYHKIEDFWSIPLYIYSVRNDYKFAVRHHYTICEDNSFLMDEWGRYLSKHYSFSNRHKAIWESVLYCK